MKAKPNGAVCGAKLRGKNKTCRKPPMANGRCRLHGGKTPSGPDSPHFKHGIYADAFRSQMAERLKKFEKEPNPLDMIPELNVQKTLLAEFIDKVSKKPTMGSLFNASIVAQGAVRSGVMIAQARNKQAFTMAEWRYLQKRMLILMEKYVPDPDRRRSFIEELLEVIPATDDAEANEPASLPPGTGTSG